ncbi:unnamed protein product [Sympodiomycopsis kandeliae]
MSDTSASVSANGQGVGASKQSAAVRTVPANKSTELPVATPRKSAGSHEATKMRHASRATNGEIKEGKTAAPALREATSSKRQINEASTSSTELLPESRVERVRRRTGVGYVGLRISEKDLEQHDEKDNRGIVWFDIDNTLYHKSTRIADLMGKRIHAYFLGLGLPEDEASALHSKYYREHGLAIRGLLKNHSGIDPLDYDVRVDGSLPLDDILRPEQELTALIRDIDRTKVRVFALTNAYKNHGLRCIRLLGLEDFFDGVVYCDYSAGPLFCCKPDKAYYEAAAELVGVYDTTKFYFVDDSEKNIKAAKEMGWRSAVLYYEPDEPQSQTDNTTSTHSQASSHAPDSDAALARLGGALSTMSDHGAFNAGAIRSQVQKLTKQQRITLLSIILDAAMPGDLFAMRNTLERHLRSTRDVVSQLPDGLALKLFERLEIKDLIACRLVSKKWLALSKHPELWRSHALALTEGDPEPVRTPVNEGEWERLVRGLYFRERNWSLGLAQTVQFCKGHTGFVTAMKLRGRTTLVTGSYDGTIRIWNLAAAPSPTCTRVIKADKIACLDFILEPGVIVAGLYDTGRILVFDLNTGELLQTLSGHNKGIRNVALNEQYLVSVGQDKAICVWNYRSGERVVRFGQQSNVSLGVCLVDTDKLVAVTIDGVIRSFSIRSKKLIGEFQLSKLGRTDAKWGPYMREFVGESDMLSWFAAHRNSITVGSKSLVAHLEWREHTIPMQRVRRDSSQSSMSSSVSGLLRSPSTSSRQRSDSLTSNASTISTRTTPSRSTASTTSGPSFTPRSSVNGGTSPTVERISSRKSVGSTDVAKAAVPASRRSLGGTSVQASSSPSPRTPSRGLAASETPTKARVTKATPQGQARHSVTSPMGPASSPAPSFPSRPSTDDLSFSSETSFTSSNSLMNGLAEEDDSRPTHRIAPNLTAAPRIVSVLRTPEVATGAVDPRKRRIVCSSRFSARAGTERTLYTSTYSDARAPRAAQAAELNGEPVPEDSPAEVVTATEDSINSTFPRMKGAWSAHAEELSTPERNPMSIVLDHESVVVGTSDGLVYRVGFVGSTYGPESSQPAPANAEMETAGDAVISVLDQLRQVAGWKDLFLPADAGEDHPGRIKRDAIKKVGLR